MEETTNGFEFVSLAAHQMRGPVGSVKGYVSMILDGDYGEVPKELIEPLNIIFKSGESLNKTINDFLDTSKMEQGQMRFYNTDFDLVFLIEQTIKEVKTNIKEGLEVKVSLPRTPVMVHGDKMKIRHVLMNLIDNAAKYTGKGYIEVSLHKHGTHKVLLAVKDNGMGISKTTLPTLFQKFSRGIEADKINSWGTGLGLYVVRKMIEAHHGKVWAESEGEGQGAQFYVEIPSL